MCAFLKMIKLLVLSLAAPFILLAQDRPGVFFREDFRETPAEIPITQEHIHNGDLQIHLHGPGASVVKKSHHDKPDDDPFYVWSGLCEGTWAVTFEHKSMNVDLSKNAKVRWRSKQSGFRALHIVLKLADGTWLVSDQSDPSSVDWRVREFNISDMSWHLLDIDKVVEKRQFDQADLRNVQEIGFSDLMRGGGSIACSRLDWIEVDGFPVTRE